ncbi:DNRLRE domain-containing protein [Carnobacteriaceae bacterium zg-ZUI240]|nr:DNRLRE domain-containing protein [Carnobacteriaceae bacterium zg-ZUI240]
MTLFRRLIHWGMVLILLCSNSPMMYAQELHHAIKQDNAHAHYRNALHQANRQAIGQDNVNQATPPTSHQIHAQSNEKPVKLPKLVDTSSDAEKELKQKYGAPIAVNGQEQLFRVTDTQFITHIGSDIKTYVDQDGRQVPVDLSLYAYHANGKHYYLPKESPVGVVLPSQVDKHTPIDIIHKDNKISLYPLDKTYDKATVLENAILYNNIDDKTDVQYTVQSNGVKEEIVLAEWTGKHTFTYGLDAKKYDVTLQNNHILVKEKGKSTILFVVNAPLMVDDAGKTSTSITLDLKRMDDVYEIHLTADKEWLADKKRQYPVRIDPTVTVPRENILDVVTSTVHGQYQGYAYGYVGYMTVDMIGLTGVYGVKDIGRSRMYFKVNYDFNGSIPSEARIDSATLNLYQYTSPGNQSTQFAAYRLKKDFDINSLTWDKSVGLDMEIAGENAIRSKKIGMHHFDIQETINGWVQGTTPNYGLVVAATDDGADGAAFYTTEATSENAGQIGFTPDKAPSLTIQWSVPDPVDVNYHLGNTTINLRAMVKTNKSGQLQFQSVFADGITTPGALVQYQLSDISKQYNGTVPASFSYKYPNTSTFEAAFEDGTTKYRDKLSNWQTLVPFTHPELNTVYTIDAESIKNNQSSGIKKSDTFLIYKVTQYDTLPKIAAYYGVPLHQLAYDNRIQDMLLVKNNTLFIRNPQKNVHTPYNPPSLTDDVKKDVDTLLMGRGLHCEFGFEPINLNTGNFYLERNDVTIPDINGAFDIKRVYNSKSTRINSLFGRGWSVAFNEQLSSDESGNLYYTRFDGSILKFTKNGDDYIAPTGYDIQLTVEIVETKQGDFGGEQKEVYPVKVYHLKDTKNQEKSFNFHGLITSQTDEKGNQTTFDYNDNYQLTKITSPTGLVFTITYHYSGYIGAIQLPNGATLTYDYNDKGFLTTYTDAMGVPTRYAYDDNGLMTAWYDGNGTKVIENVYDDQGRVVKQTDGNGAVSTLAYRSGETITTDANGYQTTYQYDEQYRTTGIIYPDGSTVSKTYDAHNRLFTQTNEKGQTTTYTYDGSGNVLTETRFDGATKTYTYDRKNHLLTRTDFDGAKTTHQYDDKGNVIQTILPDGTTITYTVDKQGRVLSITDAVGSQTSFAYDGAKLVKVTNPLGGVSTLTYNAHHQVVSITNPHGGVTTLTYDMEGRKLSEKDADGVGTTQIFDSAGQVTAVTDGNGNTVTFTYDASGRKLTSSNGEGGQYRYVYDGAGNTIQMVDAQGNTTIYQYDNRHRLVQETKPFGETIHYTLDALGQVVSKTNEAGHTSYLTYDDRYGLVKTVTDALGQVTQYDYDTVGRLVETIYPIGTRTQSTYDALGRLISYTDEAGQKVDNTYDVVGRKISATLNGKTTRYTYDDAGHVTRVIYPDETSVSYTYDKIGNILTFTDALGQTTTYEYLPSGRLVAVVNPLNQRISMTYDKNGNQNSVTDAAGYTATRTYTGQNQVANVTDALGYQTHFTYNQMEQLTEQVNALGGKTNYAYNALGYPIQITDANGNRTQLSYSPTSQVDTVTLADGSTITQTYDALDRLIKQTYSSGLVKEFTYDAANRVLSKIDNQGLHETYTYDLAGNVIRVTNSLNQVTQYQYNGDNQLIKVLYPDETYETFTYNVMGKLATSTDKENHTKTYHYDHNGNVIKVSDHLNRETHYTYDVLNRLITERNVDGKFTQYTYDVLGNVSKITDANGYTSQYRYDANKRLVMYTDNKNQTTAFQYDPLNRVTEIVMPTTSTQNFTYDALGNRLTQTSGESNTTTYTYDVMNRLSSVKRPTGGVTAYTYDGTGSLESVTDANGYQTKYINDLYGRTISRELPNQATYTYVYDVLGRLEKQTGPQGLSKTYTYDVSGHLVKEIDQSNRHQTYAYDKMGRLIRATNALDLETQYTYDSAGNLSKIKRPTGATTTFDYTLLNQIKAITTPTGRKVETSYDPVGNVTKRTINGKREEAYTYDPNGNLLEQINPLGQKKQWRYDALNRVISERDTANQAVAYTYDKDNRVVNITDEAGGIARVQYDGNGNVTSVFSGNERVKSYAYDAKDQLIRATQGTGSQASTTTYTYDSVGNVLTQTNGNGHVTTYTYDQLSNVVSRMSSLGDKTQYTYNINNQLEKITKSDGKTITYDYNKLDQLLRVDYSEKQDGQVVYTYDADGRRVSMSDLTGKTQYAYNDEGELLGVRQGDGSLIEYRYDEFGNIIQMIYPDGSQVHYTYDELDRLTSVTDTTGKKTTYHYNEAGDMFHISRGDGTQSYLTYDKAHRVSEIKHLDTSHTLISRYAYTYDDGGYITTETITQQGETIVQRYTYDTLGQIIKMTVEEVNGTTLATLDYDYDLSGNKLSSVETVDGVEKRTQFKYDDNNRLISLESADGTIHYTYDANGNRISQSNGNEKIDYIYDTENRLLAVKDNKGLLMAALYDGDSNRVFTASRKEGHHTYQIFQRDMKKRSPKTSVNGEEHSLFWYGFTQNVLQSLASLPQTIGHIWHSLFDDVSTAYHQKVAKDRANQDGLVVDPPELGNLPGNGDVVYASQVKDVLIPYTTREDYFHYFEERNYVNDMNRQHTQVLQTYNQELKTKETYTYGMGRNSYYNHETQERFDYLTNQSGSVTGLIKDGQVVAHSQYQLYGGFKTTTDTTGNVFHYNGEARDVTGLDYLRARYYDSRAGTFLSQDTYQGSLYTPLSQNLYAYVKNNPVNYTDPSGHFWHHIGNFFNAVGDTAKKAWNATTEVIGNVWNAVVDVGKKVIHGVVDTATNIINEGIKFVGNVIDGGVKWVQNTWNATTQFVSNVWQSTTEFVSDSVHVVKETVVSAYEYAKSTGQSVYDWGVSTTREAGNIVRNWTKALEETIRHVCETAGRITEDAGEFLKDIDWGKVGIIGVSSVIAIGASILTGGAATPYIAGLVGNLGLTGVGGMIVSGAGVGAIAGATGGGTYALSSGVLSGKPINQIGSDVGNGILGGAVAGGLTGGLLGGLGSLTSKVSNPLGQYLTQTVGETAIDTGVDAVQGGSITPENIAMNLFINSISNGVSNRNTTAPKASNVSGVRLRKDVTPVQELALPGPKGNKLALPIPNDIVTIQVSKSKYPQSAQHIQDARSAGQPSILTIDRSVANENRSQSLKGIDKIPGKDLDEYPPAMFAEGGKGASVRPINKSDNRGSGSSMGHQLRGFDNGTKVFIDIVD